MVGASLSVTVTVKVHVDVSPAAFATSIVTTVVPTSNSKVFSSLERFVFPYQMKILIVSSPTLSDTSPSGTTGSVTVTVAKPASVLALMFMGHFSMVGGCSSLTVTLKLQVVLRPAASVTSNVTSVVRSSNSYASPSAI
eukprot:1474963-Rhodomonas_salina.1